MQTIWPAVANALAQKSVKLLCDEPTLAAIPSLRGPSAEPAPEDAYRTEHLSLVLSVKTISSLSAAIKHINAYSSHHTDCIVTEDDEAANIFVRGVDSAGTYVNASTRFADGFRYGFGAEVGIATGRIHARGPVGLEGLCTYKYVLKGAGHVVGEFGSGPEQKKYKHKPLPKNGLPQTLV